MTVVQFHRAPQTLKTQLADAKPLDRSRLMARAFVEWCREDGRLVGEVTIAEVRAAFAEFLWTGELYDEAEDGSVTVFGVPWIGMQVPGWLEVSRKIWEVGGVSKRTLTAKQAKRKGLEARCQVWMIDARTPLRRAA